MHGGTLSLSIMKITFSVPNIFACQFENFLAEINLSDKLYATKEKDDSVFYTFSNLNDEESDILENEIQSFN